MGVNLGEEFEIGGAALFVHIVISRHRSPLAWWRVGLG